MAEDPPQTGITLSELLGRVRGAVSALDGNVWVRAEVSHIKQGGETVYIDLVEQSEDRTKQLAKAQAVVWRAAASGVLARFEKATGSALQPGMKVLVRTTCEFTEIYGLRLRIGEIDPRFTLGDLEAKLREIRATLKEIGEYGRQKSLPMPGDLTRIGIVAPEMAAGLGDVMREANALANGGVCAVDVRHAVFQSNQAPVAIKNTLGEMVRAAAAEGRPYDVILIVRGGGATTDLAYLNDLALARTVARCPVPIWTGIGHERDNTILDEVAALRFDTPSKAMHTGVLSVIKGRADAIRELFAGIQVVMTQRRDRAALAVDRKLAAVERGARHQCEQAGRRTQEDLSAVREAAIGSVGRAKGAVDLALRDVRNGAQAQLKSARESVQTMSEQGPRFAQKQVASAATAVRAAREKVAQAARSLRREAAERVESNLAAARRDGADVIAAARQGLTSKVALIEQNAGFARRSRQADCDTKIAAVTADARRITAAARAGVQAKFNEVVAQGPERSMRRGFAVVRQDGKAVRKAAAVQAGQEIVVDMTDGNIQAVVKRRQVRTGETL